MANPPCAGRNRTFQKHLHPGARISHSIFAGSKEYARHPTWKPPIGEGAIPVPKGAPTEVERKSGYERKNNARTVADVTGRVAMCNVKKKPFDVALGVA